MPSTVNQNGPIVVQKATKAAKTADGDITKCDPIFAAAKAGDLRTINEILDKDATKVNAVCESCRSITPVIAAAVNGKLEAVQLLCNRKADVEKRDIDGYTIIKLALDSNQVAIAKWLVDCYPSMIVTDPRLQKGKDWLKTQFKKMSENVPDEASKPPQSVLDYLLTGDEGQYKAVKGRSVSEVYWEHILLRYIGDVPLDIRRNYSTELKLAFVGTFDRILYGHNGIKESARLLNCVLPTTQYSIIGTHVVAKQQWVTERWEYHDPKNGLQVLDGIDTFLIDENEGQIAVKLINYRVYKTEFIDNPKRCRLPEDLKSGV